MNPMERITKAVIRVACACAIVLQVSGIPRNAKRGHVRKSTDTNYLRADHDEARRHRNNVETDPCRYQRCGEELDNKDDNDGIDLEYALGPCRGRYCEERLNNGEDEDYDVPVQYVVSVDGVMHNRGWFD